MSGSILAESRKARKNGFAGFFKRKSIIAALVIVSAGAGGWYYYQNSKKALSQSGNSAPKEYSVKRADLQIAIEGDGKVVSENGVELSFSVSADTLEVENVYVKQGDKIKKGDKIASVKTSDLKYAAEKAYASYQAALASYNDKIAGATDKEKADAKSAIDQAQISLDQGKISLDKTRTAAANSIADAEEALADAKEDMDKNQNEAQSEDIKSAYSDIVDTVKGISISLESILSASDKIIGVDNTSINDEFEVNLGVKDLVSLNDAKISYNKASTEKNRLNDLAVGLARTSSHSAIDAAAAQADAALSTFEDHLYKMQKMLENTIVSASLSQAELDAFKSTISSNRTAINTKITSLNSNLDTLGTARDNIADYVEAYEDAVKALGEAKTSAEQDIANSESSLKAKELSLKNAKADYEELLKPLTDSELASARSSLTTSAINLDQARNDLNKAVLTSPIDGQVALLNYKAGDIIISADNKPMATIINNDTLFVELDIEEADISKLKAGQSARATFDSLDSLSLDGEVIFISQTSETSNNGIVTYLVRVVLKDTANSNIREGMTTAVKFITSGVSNVLQVPVSAVRNVGGKPSVKLKNGEWAVVTTGFTDGKNVEIQSGVKEGDIVLY